MLLISFIVMYLVMFLNVDRFEHIYLSLSRTYMTLLMVSPMALLMLGMMPMMYKNKKLNMIIAASAIVVFIAALAGLRSQAMISDIQYMKAMIPHHSSAILTSRNANIKDPEVKRLADEIIKAQEEEITKMKQFISRIENME
ncbi:MAG: DUF305 domain-containing protein [Bacteroidia bacterium]